MATRFKPGDLVNRPRNAYDPKSPLRHGTVSRVYTWQSKLSGFYPELYEVVWSDGKVESGFLPHGLNPDE